MPDDGEGRDEELDWDWAEFVGEEVRIRHVPTPAPEKFEDEERPTSPRAYSLLELAASIGDRVGIGDAGPNTE